MKSVLIIFKANQFIVELSIGTTLFQVASCLFSTFSSGNCSSIREERTQGKIGRKIGVSTDTFAQDVWFVPKVTHLNQIF